MNTPQHTRINTAVALAIIVGVIGTIIYALLILSAIPAHGQIIITPMPRPTATPTLRPVAWLMAQKHYVAPVQSSCVAPGPCEMQETNYER